jgi:hypothetical protein
MAPHPAVHRQPCTSIACSGQSKHKAAMTTFGSMHDNLWIHGQLQCVIAGHDRTPVQYTTLHLHAQLLCHVHSLLSFLHMYANQACPFHVLHSLSTSSIICDAALHSLLPCGIASHNDRHVVHPHKSTNVPGMWTTHPQYLSCVKTIGARRHRWGMRGFSMTAHPANLTAHYQPPSHNCLVWVQEGNPGPGRQTVP